MPDKYSSLESELLKKRFYKDEANVYEDFKNRRRRRRLQAAMSLAPVPILISALMDVSEPIRIAAFALSASIFVTTLFVYLQPNRVNKYLYSKGDALESELAFIGYKNKELEVQNKELRKKIDQIISQLQKGEGGKGLFSQEEKSEIQESIKAKLESDALEDYKRHVIALVEQELTSKSHDTIFEQTSSRIENEIQNQAKRGNVNLLLGISTTLAGVGLLGYSVFNAPPAETTIDLAAHFIPRVSLVLLIEVFAYFFLKLYKQSLTEIKYFQNELTNIESKYLGVKLASGDDPGVLSEAIGKLLSTERNFILEKGQTTVELEKERFDSDRSAKLTSALENAVSKIK